MVVQSVYLHDERHLSPVSRLDQVDERAVLSLKLGVGQQRRCQVDSEEFIPASPRTNMSRPKVFGKAELSNVVGSRAFPALPCGESTFEQCRDQWYLPHLSEAHKHIVFVCVVRE